ncbi:MAG: cohesin domain-containing protein [Lysobacterales bacterium]
MLVTRHLFIAATIFCLPLTSYAQQAALDVGVVSGVAGTRVTVPIDLVTNDEIAAMQLDLTFPASLVSPEDVTLGIAASNHLSASAFVGGVYRVVVYSPTNAPLSSGRLVNVGFDISAGANPQTVPVGIQGVVFSRSNATGIPPSNLDPGSITISGASGASFTINATQISGPSPVSAAGETLGYSVVIQNTGGVNQSGVSASATLPGGSAGVLVGPVESVAANGILDTGESWTYQTTYVTTQADIDAGSTLQFNTQASTTQVPVPSLAAASTPVLQAPNTSIVKTQTSGPNPATTAGQQLGYTIVVTNTGNITQSSVNVSETLPDGSVGSLPPPVQSILNNATLEVGETWTYQISYTVRQVDIDAVLPLVNTARVSTSQVPGPKVSTATTQVLNPALFANGFENLTAALKIVPGQSDIVVRFALDADASSGPLLVALDAGGHQVFRLDLRAIGGLLELQAVLVADDRVRTSNWVPVQDGLPVLLNFWNEQPPDAKNGGLQLWSDDRQLLGIVGTGRDGVVVSELRYPDPAANERDSAAPRQLQFIELLEHRP